MIDVLIVNLNCLNYTKNVISDLKRQVYTDFNLTIMDQNSVESGTKEYLNSLNKTIESDFNIIHNTYNVPLNAIWNSFVEKSKAPIICLLNNDIRIPSNFLYDIVRIFKENPGVGAVMHPTNHPNYCTMLPELKFEILPHGKYRQGWDICIRKEVWTPIPECLKLYCGDDYIFEHMYRMGYSAAIAVSSPMIHYLGRTRKSTFNKILPERNPTQDIANYRDMGYTHYMVPPIDYTIVDFSQSPIQRIRE